MPSKKQLNRLKKGKDDWNRWRSVRPHKWLKLSNAILQHQDLNGMNLSDARLDNSYLSYSSLINADLSNSNMEGAILAYANLRGANLSKTNLRNAALHYADLRYANLVEADLSFANLSSANLASANLRGAHMYGTIFNQTIMVDTDLSNVNELGASKHESSSFIDHNTFKKSGHIPKAFLHACGWPEKMITEMASLLAEDVYHTCFISYSSKDEAFTIRLHRDLQERGVNCWFAPSDMRIGDDFEQRVEQSIGTHGKLLVVISKNSIASSWVEREVVTALAREKEQASTVVFPITLDDSITRSKKQWALEIRKSRHIGDFTLWQQDFSYWAGIDRLIRDLKVADTKRERVPPLGSTNGVRPEGYASRT